MMKQENMKIPYPRYYEEPEHERVALNERLSWTPLVFSRARVERHSFFEKWALSWAPLAIFIEERELSASQILSLKTFFCSKI